MTVVGGYVRRHFFNRECAQIQNKVFRWQILEVLQCVETGLYAKYLEFDVYRNNIYYTCRQLLSCEVLSYST